MGRNPERDARALAARKQKILAGAFRVFSAKGIDSVSMNDVASACRIGCATLYRHYATKAVLAAAVAEWTWENMIGKQMRLAAKKEGTGAELLGYFLDAVVELYRKHPDSLRYEQFFQVFARNEHLLGELMEVYHAAMNELNSYFQRIYDTAKKDGTLRTEASEKEMFSFCFQSMMAFACRASAGLSYMEGMNAESELLRLRSMILREFGASKA